MSARLLFVALIAPLLATPVLAAGFGFPVACTPGTDCFVQQFPDTDPGTGAEDPFCGTATYDGHKGTDIRIRSLADMERGYGVRAVADGTVLRLRADMEDHLIATTADANAVRDRECGNGIVMDLGAGLSVQYCHLAANSITIAPGDSVDKGTVLGKVGASGLAEFPHVHVQFTRDEVLIDPTTGRRLDAGCAATPDPARSLWDAKAAPVFFAERTQLLAAGFANGAVDHDGLVVRGPPPPPTTNDTAMVAWAWLINLEAGDIVAMRLEGPSGVIAANTFDPLARAKATYSFFTGKRMAVAPGTYSLRLRVERKGAAVIDETKVLTLG